MKALKYIGLALLAIILIYVIAAAVSPKEQEVSVTYHSDQPVDKLYTAASDFHHFANWNAWSKMEEDESTEIIGSGNAVGDIWKWEGDTIGKGELENLELVENQKIVREMRFFIPWESTGKDIMEFKETEEGTEIVWKSLNEVPFMMRPVFSAMMNATLKPQLESGLKNMEKLASEIKMKPESHMSEITVEEMDAVQYIGIRRMAKVSELADVFTDRYGQLDAFCKKHNIEPAGMPMAFYHTWDGIETDLEAAFPVAKKVSGEGDIHYGTMPAMQVVSAVHYGPYESSESTHMAIDSYLEQNELVNNGPVCEIYMNDPSTVAPEEIQTKIMYPVK